MFRGNHLSLKWFLLAAWLRLTTVALGQPPPEETPPSPGPALGNERLAPEFEITTSPMKTEEGLGGELCAECGTVYGRPAFGRLMPCPTSGRSFFGSPFGSPPPRHRGLGRPLQGESWLYRPFSSGWFMGMIQGSPLINDWVGEGKGFVGGYRFGWDHNYYWGGEMRFTFGSVRLFDSPQAIAAQQAADDAAGVPAEDPWRQRFDQRRDVDLFQWDVGVLYYPWGDAQWRPYWSLGLGAARVIFIDRLSTRFDKVVLTLPMGVGLKYRCNDWLALRFELADNIAFGGGSGFNTLHNLAITGGVEIRFGGSRKAYWPWNPGRHYW